ncbi:hypothetical protein D0809_00300 [Flavobacterium circumlabens]|uniref:Tetratricopeptide repeat protein n=1 Tax=Flavobacterium circumlabens TaxID=2133765 RepID=A0A4Y7UHZ6_9FLAO|nr:tetratricopeptide repeat protein [Flavobacterium circumlabens]TCN52524.1 hypothetical protein EV142_11062 [Flavobacterium circumlabens]TEB45488.1 hypothetical protein D0809_00300 [Flavobacterium circumlabens]
MNVTDYTHLINKPDAITEKQTEALGNVLNEFPYFQSARALRLKGLYNQNSFKYNYALKVTAAHTTDRSVLFDFITSETFVSIQNEYYDQKLKDLLNITVFESEVVIPEIQKVPAIRIDPIEQSILSSIREATTVVFEEHKKPEEKPVDVVVEQPVLTPVKEEVPVFIEEPIAIEEITLDSFVEQIVSPAVKEEVPIVIEEPITVEEITIDSFVEQSVPTSVEEETPIVTEEPIRVEEITIDSFVEQPASTSVEETPTVTEEPIRVEEITIDSFVEQPASTSVEETPIVTEEPIIVEEITIDSFVEQPVSASEEEETPIVTEEPIIEEEREQTPDIRVEPIEESVYNSIKQATTVVFEDLKETEVPKEVEVSETVKNAEENLEIGKPLDFSVNEKHSFQEWLQLARTEPIDRTKEGPAENKEKVKEAEKAPEPITQPVAETEETESIEEEKKKKAEIINKFIQTNPKIPPIKPTAIVPTVMLDPNKNEDNSYLMTETLARVYLEQKKYTKAIQAYEILILKYPEKISFFADRISDIKILQQNNNNN